jgi:TolB-like protein/Flp pilus assembly protein TadD
MNGLHSRENPGTPLTDAAAARKALARILATERFKQSEALARWLRLVVEDNLAGRECELKESQGAKLRARLLEYYAGEGYQDPVRIHLLFKDGSIAVFLSAPPPRQPARRRWFWLSMALCAAILLGWAGSWWRAQAASAEIRSLAVLPFVEIGPQQDGAWFGDGVTEGIIDALTRLPGLRVAARTSAFQFPGNARDLSPIGRQLGVAAVLEGSIRKAGGRLRIAAQMTRASDGYHLWSQTFDLPAQDLLAVQQQIAAALARRIQIPSAPSPHRHQPPQQAYARYLEGRYFLDRPEGGALDKAVERLEESTAIDPEFALAWAWLSIAREYRVDAGMARPNQAMPGSRDAAERAVALDPDCAEAHLALGIVKLQYDWDWAGARQELDHALRLNPGSGLVRRWRARWFETQGRTDEAISESARALSIDPLSGVILGDLAGLYLSVNQPERALPFAQRAAEIRPGDGTSQVTLASALWLAGQKEKSRQIVEELRHSPGAAKVSDYLLATISAQQGDPAGARQLLDEAEDLPADQPIPATTFARLAAVVGDWDRLFSWIEEAYDERDVRLPYLRSSPDMPPDLVQSDPRFAAFLEKMNLPAAVK